MRIVPVLRLLACVVCRHNDPDFGEQVCLLKQQPEDGVSVDEETARIDDNGRCFLRVDLLQHARPFIAEFAEALETPQDALRPPEVALEPYIDV